MSGFLLPVITLVLKDILLEVRNKEAVSSILLFGFLVAIIFNFAFDPTPKMVGLIVPGIIWVSFTFAGVLGFNRSFVLEKDNGSIDGLMLCPVSRDVIYFGKLIGIVIVLLFMEILLLPVFAILYDFPLFIPELLIIAVLATIGFSAVGVLFSAIAVNTRSRVAILPLIILPLTIPVIIAAVEATSAIIYGDALGSVGRWWQLLAAFDVILLVLSSILFGAVLEE